MGSRTTIQLVLIIISIVIIVTYIRPTFGEMQKTQDETQQYRDALDNAAKFNQELQRLVSEVNGFSTTDRRSLDRFLPTEIDAIAVMRDIETIVNNNQMGLAGLSSDGLAVNQSFTPAQGQTPTENQLISQSFSVQVVGTYEQFKTLLQDFERNAYPLEVTNLNFTSVETGNLYSFAITLSTYAFGESNMLEN